MSYSALIRSIGFSLLILFSVINVIGQSVLHIGVEEGLRDRDVKKVFQDSRGLIWIFTKAGMHLYDGYNVEFYESEMNNLGGFGMMLEDSNGHLYYIKKKGVSVIDLLSRTEKNLLRYDRFHGVYIDLSGNIALYVDAKKLNFNGKDWKEVPIQNELIKNKLEENYRVYQMNDGTLQLRGSKKHNILFDKNGKVVAEFTVKNHEGPTDSQGGVVMRDSTGHYWMNYIYGRFRKWNEESQMFQMTESYKQHFDERSHANIFDGEDHFTLLGNKMIYGLNPYNDSLFVISDQLPQDFVGYEYLIKDQNGSYFVCGDFGLYIVNTRNLLFSSLLSETDEKPFDNSVRTITPMENQRLLISTLVHDYIYDMQTESIQIIQEDYRQLFGVIQLNDDEYWGTCADGLLEINIDPLRYVLRKELVGNTKHLKNIYKHNDNILISHNKQLILASGRWQDWQKVEDWTYGRANTFYCSQSGNDSLWISTVNGLVLVNDDLEVLAHYSTGTHPALSDDFVHSVIKMGSDQLWICTEDGVDVLNLKTNKITLVPNAESLKNTSVYAVIPDRNRLWMPTDRGLGLYEMADETLVKFDRSHGLSHYEFNSNAFAKLGSKLFLGTLNGVGVVDLDRSYVTKRSIPIFIKNIKLYNSRTKNIESRELSTNEPRLNIAHYESNLQLEVGMAHYDNPTMNIIEYKIVGFHRDWNIVSGNKIIISNLPEGDYELMIRGKASDATTSDQIVKVYIRYQKAYYQQWWFIILIAMLLSTIFYGIYRWRMNQINKVIRIREKIAANLHDDVGSMMTRIAFESDLIQAKVYDEEESKLRLKSISEQSREATQTMSDIIWSFDTKNDSYESLIDRMKQNLFDLLSPHDIAFSMDSKIRNKDEILDPIFRQNIYLIFKEAIHNIIKHSNATRVNVKINNQNNFELIVQDNGTETLDKGYPSSGMGITNMHNRATAIGGTLRITKSDGHTITFRKK